MGDKKPSDFYWHKLVAKHPTEWQGLENSAYLEKFKAVLTEDHDDNLLKEQSDAVIAHEEKRIEKLGFWDKVEELGSNKTPYHFHPIAFLENVSIDGVLLRVAQELALRVSGGFEGKGNLDYHALADDHDGQGTSFGLIQWNFGQDTLRPVLLRMYNSNPSKFADCFPSKTNYEDIRLALINNNQQDQLTWVRELLTNNRSGWSTIFQNIGDVVEFQDIQFEEALTYHNGTMECINSMRKIAPDLMGRIEVVTYVALYDLAVQQGSLNRGSTIQNIITRYQSEKPKTQIEFLTIAVQERARTAKKRWRADCISRRMGIIQKSQYAANENGHKANRSNLNFYLLDDYEGRYIHDL